ncbi:MAG: 2-oxo acid dehydrogenase subunit E2 [Clostridia bacterium]|nr:2-oxo acid dehydrogenase subunit E2 [Clostridia bacterium]
MAKKRIGAFEVPTDPIFKMILQVMPHRYDATNFSFIKLDCTKIDKFIAEQRQETGITYTYMDVVLSAIVRCLARFPHLNRYVMNGRLYENYKITSCFTIKTKLDYDSLEEQVRKVFNGNETIAQIKKSIDDEIALLRNPANDSDATQMANLLSGLPMFAMRAGVKFLKRSDKKNRFLKLIKEVSPFHSSFWLANLKSLKMDAVAHHCYDFGTISLFFTIGKEQWEAVVDENGEITKRLMLPMGLSIDERICDGYAISKALKGLKFHIENPEVLLEEFHSEKVDAEIEKDKEEARILAEKEAKRQAKLEKKNGRKNKQK